MSENQAPQDGDLSPEEAERLAERLKPSWEIDEQPSATAGAVAYPQPPAAASVGAPLQHLSALQAAPTQPAPPTSEAPPIPIVPFEANPAAGSAAAASNAAARSRHGQTVLGMAPPSRQDPASGFGMEQNPYAMPAVPSPPLGHGEHALPSVVLADPGGGYPPPVANAPAASGPRFQPSMPSYSDLDYDLPIRRSSKAPLWIGLLMVIGGGIAAYTLVGPGRAPSSPSVPVATTVAPPSPPALAPQSPPAPIPQPAAVMPPPSTAPAVAAESPAKAREPSSAKGSVGNATDENAATRSREVGATPRNAAPSQPRPVAVKPVVPSKPAPPSRPSGGIVRDVPF